MKKKFAWKLVGTVSAITWGVALLMTGCSDDPKVGGAGGSDAARGGASPGVTGGSSNNNGSGGRKGGSSNGGMGGMGGIGGLGGMGGSGGSGGSGGRIECEHQVSVSGDGMPIVGSYVDDFGSPFVVTSSKIDNYGLFHLSHVNASAGFAITRNDAENLYFPCAWSVFVWTEKVEGLYYCQSVFNAETSEAASAAPLPDPDNLTSGCGSFPWSTLTVQ